jgi:hypothetical protein
MSIGFERQRLAAVAKVSGDLRHRQALADLDADEPVAEGVRAPVRGAKIIGRG